MFDLDFQPCYTPLVRERSRVQSSLVAPQNHQKIQWFMVLLSKGAATMNMQNDAGTRDNASHVFDKFASPAPIRCEVA